MRFCISASGRACLNDWERPLAVADVLNLLLALKRAHARAGVPVIFILVIRDTIPAPGSFLINCLQATVPAILDCCEHLIVVIEGSAPDRALLRNAFKTTRRTPGKHAQLQIFDSLSTAFTHAQHLAPHDVLELQGQLLHRRFSPNGSQP